jgi:flavin reductase (DIM6/NTAB) family NADH-FMN oxidoreductase RutF
MDEIAKKELRRVLGAFVTGVTVMTTLDEDGRPQGCTVNSLAPPLVL